MAELFIGLMSGTSMDSIDAALVQFTGDVPRLVEKQAMPLPAVLREALLALAQPGYNELDRVGRLDSAVARLFAKAVYMVLDEAGITSDQVRAIGSHGQTIRHAPHEVEPYTIQIGNPNLLAELTHILTVTDFRRRDMAAGGQGAPLAPAFHAAFFRDSSETRTVVNIGGMANITILPTVPNHPVSGFDTGPGNVLLDTWAQRHLGIPLDRAGTWGNGGQVIPGLLACFLEDDYFTRLPPKSTGRELFNLDWLEVHLAAWNRRYTPQDVQATLVELTACSIAAEVRRYAPRTARVLVCGGGVHNAMLMARLQNHCGNIPVESTAIYGIDPDYLEAMGFAWLAKRTLEGLPGNLPEVTGAKGLRILGGIYPAYSLDSF